MQPADSGPEAPFVVALDGPAGSGKSTVGIALARALGFFYLDTGLLYRALTWAALQRDVKVDDGTAMERLAHSVRVEVRPPSVDDGRQVDLLVDGEDVSTAVRLPAVDRSVSAASAHAGVRDAMRGVQREAVRAPGTILAGRDIGTVIVPEAPLKVWLTASREERARRRAAETGEAYPDVLRAMERRDELDSTRAVAPMVRADDAVEVDTDGISPEEVTARIAALVRARLAPVAPPAPKKDDAEAHRR